METGREHLIPMQTVRSDGATTTVYVAPETAIPERIVKRRKEAISNSVKSSVRGIDDLGYGTIQGSKSGSVKGLYDYQTETSQALLDELKLRDRASASLACGMGKTVVAQKLILDHYNSQESDTGVYIFVTSGIRLTDQSREAFGSNGIIGEHEVFTVHSESSDYAKARNQFSTVSVEAAETAALTEFLSKPSDHPKIIFATYDSAEKIARVQKGLNGHDADLTILDESHRLSGEYKFNPKDRSSISELENADTEEASPSGRVPRLLFNGVAGSVRSTKRVFLTATPSFEEEYGDAYIQTRAVKEKGSKTSPPYVYDVSEKVLREVAEDEDALRSTKRVLHIDQMNEEVFGRSVKSYDLNYAIAHGALTEVERTAAVVRSKVPYHPDLGRIDYDRMRLDSSGAPSPTGMAAESYVAVSSTLQALADGDGDAHNVLAFLSLNENTRDFASGWKGVAASMVGDNPPSPVEARFIVDHPGNHDVDTVRRARLALLGEHASVSYAYSNLPKSERDRAYKFFNDGNQTCTCGGKAAGTWCACARVVSNFDLFGQGIDIKQVDTVVQANRNRLNDAAITQSVGRAARLHKDEGGNSLKRGARVVTPILTFDTGDDLSPDTIINSDTVSKTVAGWSRMGRNVARAAFERRQMIPADEKPVRILGGDHQLSTTETYAQVSGNPVTTFVQHKAYKWIRDAVDTSITNDVKTAKALHLEPRTYTVEERDAACAEFAATSNNEFVKIIRASKYPDWDRELAKDADRRWSAVSNRMSRYDKDSMTPMENLLLHADNQLSADFQKMGSYKGYTTHRQIWALGYNAPEASVALRDMGVPEEVIKTYADLEGRFNVARIKSEARDQAKLDHY